MGKRWKITWTLIGIILVSGIRGTAMGFEYASRGQSPPRGNLMNFFSNMFQQQVSKLIHPFEEKQDFNHFGPYQRPAQQSDLERYFLNFGGQGHDVCSDEEGEYTVLDYQWQSPCGESNSEYTECNDGEHGIQWKGSPVEYTNVEIEEVVARNFKGLSGDGGDDSGTNFNGFTKLVGSAQEPGRGKDEKTFVESTTPRNEYFVLLIKKEHILGGARVINQTSIDALIGASLNPTEEPNRAASPLPEMSTVAARIPFTTTEGPTGTCIPDGMDSQFDEGPIEGSILGKPQPEQSPANISGGPRTVQSSSVRITEAETVSQRTEGPKKISFSLEANSNSSKNDSKSPSTSSAPATDPTKVSYIPFTNNGRPTLIYTIVPTTGGDDGVLDNASRSGGTGPSENSHSASSTISGMGTLKPSHTIPNHPQSAVGIQNAPPNPLESETGAPNGQDGVVPTAILTVSAHDDDSTAIGDKAGIDTVTEVPTPTSDSLPGTETAITDAAVGGKAVVDTVTVPTAIPTVSRHSDDSAGIGDKAGSDKVTDVPSPTSNSPSGTETAITDALGGRTSPHASSFTFVEPTEATSAGKSDPELRETNVVYKSLGPQSIKSNSQPMMDEDALAEEETTEESLRKPEISTTGGGGLPLTGYSSTQVNVDKSTTVDAGSTTPTVFNNSPGQNLEHNSTDSSQSNDSGRAVNIGSQPENGKSSDNNLNESTPVEGNAAPIPPIPTAFNSDSQSPTLGSEAKYVPIAKVNESLTEESKPNGTKSESLGTPGPTDDIDKNKTGSQMNDKNVLPTKDDDFDTAESRNGFKIPGDLKPGRLGSTITTGSGEMPNAYSSTLSSDDGMTPANHLTTTVKTSTEMLTTVSPAFTGQNSLQSDDMTSPKSTGGNSQRTHPTADVKESSANVSSPKSTEGNSPMPRPNAPKGSSADMTSPNSTEGNYPMARPNADVKGSSADPPVAEADAPSTTSPSAEHDIHNLGHAIRGLHDLVNKLMSTVNSSAAPSATKKSFQSTESPQKITENSTLNHPNAQQMTEALHEQEIESPPLVPAKNPDPTTVGAITTPTTAPSTVTAIDFGPTEANSPPTDSAELPVTESTTMSADVIHSQSPKSTTEAVIIKSDDQPAFGKDSQRPVDATKTHASRKPNSSANEPRVASGNLITDTPPKARANKPAPEGRHNEQAPIINKVNKNDLSLPTEKSTPPIHPTKHNNSSQSPADTLPRSLSIDEDVHDTNDTPVTFTESSYDASSFTSTPSQKRKPPPSRGFHKILRFMSWMRGKKNADNSTEADATRLTETAFDPIEEIIEGTNNGTRVIDKDVLPESLANWFLGFRSSEDDDSSNTSSVSESISSEGLDSSAEFRDLYHSFLEAAMHNVNNASAIVNASEPVGTPLSWWSGFRGAEADSQPPIDGSSIVNGSSSRWRLGRWLPKLRGLRNMLKGAATENGVNVNKTIETSSQSTGGSFDDRLQQGEATEESERRRGWFSDFWGNSSDESGTSSAGTGSQSETTQENAVHEDKDKSDKSTRRISGILTNGGEYNTTSTVNGNEVNVAATERVGTSEMQELTHDDSTMTNATGAAGGATRLGAGLTEELTVANSTMTTATGTTDGATRLGATITEELSHANSTMTSVTVKDIIDEDDSTVKIVFTEQKSKLLSLLAEMQEAQNANATQQETDLKSEAHLSSTSAKPSTYSHFYGSDFEVWSDEDE